MPDEPLNITQELNDISADYTESPEITITTVAVLPPDITLPPGGPPYVEGAEDDGRNYWSYACSVEYVWDEGIRVAPKAGPRRTPAAVWRCHSGICYKVVSFACQRFRQMPVPPHPDTGSPNEIYLGKVLNPTRPDDMPDQGELFTLVGQYVYLLVVGPDDNDPLPVPGSPLRAAATNTLNINDFSKYLLPAVQVAQGFTQGFTG